MKPFRLPAGVRAALLGGRLQDSASPKFIKGKMTFGPYPANVKFFGEDGEVVMEKFGVVTEIDAEPLQGKAVPVEELRCPRCESLLNVSGLGDPRTPTFVGTCACPNCGTEPFER